MKLLMIPVEMIAKFTVKGQPRPVKFRIENDMGLHEIKVGSIVCQEEEKLAGNRMIKYQCQSAIRGIQTTFELKYELATCKWYLSKM